MVQYYNLRSYESTIREWINNKRTGKAKIILFKTLDIPFYKWIESKVNWILTIISFAFTMIQISAQKKILHILSVRFLFIQRIPVIERENEKRQTDRQTFYYTFIIRCSMYQICESGVIQFIIHIFIIQEHVILITYMII